MPLTQFHPAVKRWFESRFREPTAPQRRGWPLIAAGENTLIAAPTGSGKTLTAFLAALDALFRQGLEGELVDETQVLYVSPLKALSNDINRNLEEPLGGILATLEDLGLPPTPVRSAVRTGDTPSSKRQAILRKPPHILVTTPESFYLLLTSASGRRMLSTVKTLIVDEIHALADNRRGSHLALSMERLENLVDGSLQRIGLSATQRPIEEVAKFLVGARVIDAAGRPCCEIIDEGHSREMDAAIEIPGSPLEAVMSHEIWEEVYKRLAELIEEHRTTLVFVNTRSMAERLTKELGTLIGQEHLTSHHGSLSASHRQDAERRLKEGELKALVATASLELGIDIGTVDLVCQMGAVTSIRTFLQRAGRSGHTLGGLPKARIFPLSRDELVETVALLRSVRSGDLDALTIPEKPLDILAQQIVASAACEEWREDELFEMLRRASPYRDLTREEYDEVVHMLATGFTTRRGRRGALIHHDGINGHIRGRRHARITALTSGGAIPDNADYRVIQEPGEMYIGTVNEDFAIESYRGDIFQLGNASWLIQRIERGTVRVEDARGRPPTIPFWFGEAPARSDELSSALAEVRADIDAQLERTGGDQDRVAGHLMRHDGLSGPAAIQIVSYLAEAKRLLGIMPTRRDLVMERFFDESGGMQLVVHTPFGSKINRAWGLALRKRFCRSFNFELQAAANENSIVLSLGAQHSFPLEEVFHYLNTATVRDVLVQALLDAPMFPTRWRWNVTRALAVLRQRGGQKVPPQIQRMEAEDLIAAVFPDQLACLENIAGDREVPDHPLVRQTIEDCLVEVMDVEGLMRILTEIEEGTIRCHARDLPEPSPLAHEILTARPYAFLDNAPLEERRTQAVFTRRALDTSSADELGALDAAAIDRVCDEAWPRAVSADEVHDALLLAGGLTVTEATRGAEGTSWLPALDELSQQGRAGTVRLPGEEMWIAAERLPQWQAVFPGISPSPSIEAPERERKIVWERAEALRELVRGRLEVWGPTCASELARLLGCTDADIDIALHALEGEGFVLRGRFRQGADELEWCNRRLLARIHRLTIERLRAEIRPVSATDYLRFLFSWQHVEPGRRLEGPEGLLAVIEQLDGFEAPASAWETDILLARMTDYDPMWLDGHCLSGQVGWGRLSPPGPTRSSTFSSGPLRSSPMAVFLKDHMRLWNTLAGDAVEQQLTSDAAAVLHLLERRGALFIKDIISEGDLLFTRVEAALGELSALGLVTSDSFAGLRALLVPAGKRPPRGRSERRRRSSMPQGIELSGRWYRFEAPELQSASSSDPYGDAGVETLARIMLRRYGVVFRKVLERESITVPWRELARCYRRLEAAGEIRGGRFVGGFSGEQFALPEAVGLLRSTRKREPDQELIGLSAADPLNLTGILLPGDRISSVANNRILLRGGIPVAALEAGTVRRLDGHQGEQDRDLELALLRRKLPPRLRAYYG